MSAKELMIFFPESFLATQMMNDIIDKLGLNIDVIPAGKNFPFQLSAQKNSGVDYLLLEYTRVDKNAIDDILQWERPNTKHKKIIANCQSSIAIYYRKPNNAKDVILITKEWLSEILELCIVENGYGCVLTLKSLVDFIIKYPEWSWEKEEFPELPDVAISEWKYLDHND